MVEFPRYPEMLEIQQALTLADVSITDTVFQFGLRIRMCRQRQQNNCLADLH